MIADYGLYIIRHMLRPPLEEGDIVDENFKQAVEVVTQYDRASASLLQRSLDIGYARAARIIDQLEAAGVVGPAEGSAPREVLVRDPQELFGDHWEKLGQKEEQEVEEWPPKPPANYKIPSGVSLSKVDVPWGTQFSEAYERAEYKESEIEFPIPLGFDENGKLRIESLLEVNNLIVTGNTLSQKENLVDTILVANLLRHDPAQLKIILIDPTHYLDLYNGIIHLLSPVINSHDKIISALKWAWAENDRRLKAFSEKGIRDLKAYNEKMGFQAVPHILNIVCPDFFDAKTEDVLTMLTAQGARTGIHTIIVVDRTSGASLPSIIKSNIPARAVFRLTSAGESRAIDVSGAEKLEPGELIYRPNYGSAVKVNAVFAPEVNVKEVLEAVKHVANHA